MIRSRFILPALITVVTIACPGIAAAQVRLSTKLDVQAQSRWFIRDHLRSTLGQRVGDHVRLARSRSNGALFKHFNGDLSRLDLPKLLSPALQGTIPEVKRILTTVNRRAATAWCRDLDALSRRARDSKLRDALSQVRDHIISKGGGPLDSSMQKTFEDIFLLRLAKRVFSHNRRARPKNSLSRLPRLPVPSGFRLTGLWLKSISRGTRAARYLYLERRLNQLQGSKRSKHRKLAKSLGAYLSTYKDSWVDGWLTARLHAYPGPDPAGRSLRDVADTSKLSSRQRGVVRQRLGEAWTTLGRVVHPALLAQVGLPRILVNPDVSRAAYKDGTITLGPGSTVATMLHEFGHHIEKRGGSRPFVTAQVVRAGRVGDGTMQALGIQELGWIGRFVEPYMGKYYFDGATEVISMGLGSLGSKAEAKRLFKQDKDYLLRVLSSLQQPPRPL